MARKKTAAQNVLNRQIGICTHFERRDNGWKVEHLLSAILELGVGVVRQEIKWADVEQERGVYEIPAVDRDWLDRTEKAGLKVILLLCYGNPLYENPLDHEGFAKYAGFLAAALKGRHILAYEIWNEPTNFHFYQQYGGSWSGSDPSCWREKFCELLAASGTAIRTADPDTAIITNPGEVQAVHMMRHHPDAFANIDGISQHPYSVRFPPETVPFGGGRISAEQRACVADDCHSFVSLFSLARKHSCERLGRELELYITEYGFTSYNHTQKPGWFRGYTELVQAAYSVRAILLALSAGVKTACLYDLMDDGVDLYEAEDNFGLLRHETHGYETKPVFTALKRTLDVLGSTYTHLSHPPALLETPNLSLTPTYFWQAEAKEPFLGAPEPITVWFKIPGGHVSFVWMSGRMQGESHSAVGQFFWAQAPETLKSVSIIDLVTGSRREIELTPPRRSGLNGEGARLPDVPVGGNPLAILWHHR